MKTITQDLLDQVTGEARDSVRLRKNYNLHPNDAFCCHRLLNAMEPGSYLQPHRHLDPNKDESMVILRGRLGVVAFDEGGAVTGTHILQTGDAVAVDMPHGEFHTVFSLEPGTVFFETKGGPYLPLNSEEKAPWAPVEGDGSANAYLASLVALFL